MSMSGELYIPEGIVADILSRLPIKAIARLRCVSRTWMSILTDPKYLKTHFKNTTKQEHIIAISPSHSLYTLSSTPLNRYASRKLNFPTHLDEKWIEIVGSCNGLVLALTQDASFLINPTTSNYFRVENLPFIFDPEVDIFVWYGLGFDVLSDDFKIVSLSYHDTETSGDQPAVTDTLVDVYSLRSNSWRRIECSPHNHERNTFYGSAGGVFLHGALHWFANRMSNGSNVIVSFNLSTERFSEVPGPDDLGEEKYVFYKLVVLKGCLCMGLLVRGTGMTEVWMMKEYAVQGSWVKLTVINPYNIYNRRWIWMPIHLVGDHELIVSDENGDCVLFIYDLRSGSLKDITPDWFEKGWTFVESLVDPARLSNTGG